MKSAKALESTGVRDVAVTIRKSGVILAKELLRSKPDTAADTVKYVDQLIQADLLHQEYVVICSKSGAHVNRVEHRETIDQMSKLGVLCSCGKRIADEAIEGLLSTDALLPKMLDKNYWMTVSVVRSLLALGVPAERILLNPSTVNDDVEILADLDGTLLMFNLKDAEYGIPHALSFTTRISMHKPSIAFLVSTRGVSNDVKDHFKRVKLDTQLVYIPNLLQLDATLKKVVEGIRLLRVKTWFDTFQSMMNFGLTPLLMQRLEQTKTETKPSPAASLMDSIKAKNSARQTLVLDSQPANQPEIEQILQQQEQQDLTSEDGHTELQAPKISAIAVPAEENPIEETPVYTAPEPITETLETSYSHHEHEFEAPAEIPQEQAATEPSPVQHSLPILPGFNVPPSAPLSQAPQSPQIGLSPAAMFAQSPFGPEEASDSDMAVSDLEELISEAKESKISSDLENTGLRPIVNYFADDTADGPAVDAAAVDQVLNVPNVPTPPVNPYKRVMEMLHPQPQVVTSVIIDDTVDKTPSAMDILDNAIEAVAATDTVSAANVQASPASPSGNIFTEQYMNYAAKVAAPQSTDEEEEQPVPTY
jgi:hypothetical protein